MLKFCLTADCEGLISFTQGNPEWGKWGNFKFFINKSIRNFRYNPKGFDVLCDTLRKTNFPATLMLVGKLFKPDYLISNVEWGYHTYNHIPLNLVSDKTINSEVKNIYKVKSITPPMWRVEDAKNPSRIYEILKKNGYKNVVYHGQVDGVKSLHKKEIRLPEKRFGMKCVYVSNYIEGNSSKKKIDNIKKEILNNLDRDVVYLLSTHDFTHRNNKNLLEIISFVINLEKNKKLKIVTVGKA